VDDLLGWISGKDDNGNTADQARVIRHLRPGQVIKAECEVGGMSFKMHLRLLNYQKSHLTEKPQVTESFTYSILDNGTYRLHPGSIVQLVTSENYFILQTPAFCVRIDSGSLVVPPNEVDNEWFASDLIQHELPNEGDDNLFVSDLMQPVHPNECDDFSDSDVFESPRQINLEIDGPPVVQPVFQLDGDNNPSDFYSNLFESAGSPLYCLNSNGYEENSWNDFF
jgi:hypothetical protein